MAIYTMSLEEALYHSGGTWHYDDAGNLVIEGGDIGLNNYPIFEEDYRPLLNSRIFENYIDEEIAHETLPFFQMRMRSRMNQIMPAYNLLYLSERLEFDPLINMDIQTDTVSENDSTTSTSVDRNATASANVDFEAGSRAVNLDTPQTALAGDEDYASNASDVNSFNTSETTSDETNNETSAASATGENESTSKTYGTQGSPIDLILRYRELALPIDKLVIEELQTLFMGVWGKNDRFL